MEYKKIILFDETDILRCCICGRPIIIETLMDCNDCKRSGVCVGCEKYNELVHI